MFWRPSSDAGITDFDVASLDEVKLIDNVFGKAAGQFFNNPAKSRPAIRAASEEHGIRFYTADCIEEIRKIIDETRRKQRPRRRRPSSDPRR